MQNEVIVITGASSGIGQATALHLAQKGANLVIAARRKSALDRLVSEIEKLGGKALAVTMDVSDEQAVYALAQAAVNHFGKITVWLNNASVAAFGEFTAIPTKIIKRVIEVNILGYIYGAKAALHYFKPAKKGSLINVASVVGTIGQPYASPYSLTKFAVRGFSEALRWEIAEDGINVCTILPASIDTHFFQHAANYSGKALKALSPTYQAEDVAKKIAEVIISPQSEVYVGTIAPILANAHKFAPDFTAKSFAAQIRHDNFTEQAKEPNEGNLFEPMLETTGVSGGWK